MTVYVENVTETEFPFDVEKTAEQVALGVLDAEECPYETMVNILLTDNAGIREYNREYRGIDRETDVLSFPNLNFNVPGGFEEAVENEADCFDPETGELILGDIVISVDRVKEQARDYGHSLKREFAFLTAHSMYHLCGYDHMGEGEAAVMEEKQERTLSSLGITREDQGKDE